MPFYPARDAMRQRGISRRRLSVRTSVRRTLVYCIDRAKDIIKLFSCLVAPSF